MNAEELEREAAALIDEFSANVEGKSLTLATTSEVDTMVIKAVGLFLLNSFREDVRDIDTYLINFSSAVALGAFLQHKGRFDIMKLRGTIQ